ncbi:MAG TPA: hypothetical protein VMW08_09680 [Acidimicrobiales bacterium]|nr:hypothetical protein [Acidimicrobiales bacterium]
MCSSCVTAAEATLIQSMVGVAAVRAAGRRLHDLWRGRPALERRLADHEATVAYLDSIGLDGDALVGAPPAIPARLAVEVARREAARREAASAHAVTT